MTTVTNTRRTAVAAQIETFGVVAVIRLKDPDTLRAAASPSPGG